MASYLCSVLLVVSLLSSVSSTGWTIPNINSGVNVWDYNRSPLPGPFPHYPFIQYYQLFTATGGCYVGYPGCEGNRDLLVDPTDPSSSYAFDPLITALKEIVASGYIPHIVTGNVPVSMSAQPHIGGFGVNVSPPSNYSIYYAYIFALASEIASTFGGAEKIRDWRWGVFTEFNNQDWFANGSKAFFKTYQTTVNALQDALGKENLFVGTHMCTQCVYLSANTSTPAWNPDIFVQDVAETQTQLDFLTNSYYDFAPGDNGTLETFETEMVKMKVCANALGLEQVHFGIDEGRILWGPEGKQLGLLSRAVGNTYQASFDAMWFIKSVNLHMEWYNRWAVNVAGNSSEPLDAVSTHVARFGAQMAGDVVLDALLSVALQNPEDIVGALTSANDSFIHVLIYNHNPQLNSDSSETVSLRVCGLDPSSSAADAVYWVVDDSHGQFWNVWWSDMASQNISSFPSVWSTYSEVVTLEDPKEAEYFTSRVPYYRQLAALSPITTQYSVDSSGCLEVTAVLAPHAVHFVEIAATSSTR